MGAMTFIVKTASEPHTAVSMLHKTMAGIDPNIPIAVIMTEKEIADLSTMPERTLETLLIALAVPSLLMACIGIYGTLTYSGVRRVSEFGIRMAMGARREHIVFIGLRESLIPVAIGVFFGIAMSLLVGLAMQGALFGVAPTDPSSLMSAALLMLVTSTLAGFIPAHRASRVDPMTALRYE
jgi:ABC-type antimicrobial peptide transport system permease subunit